MAIFDLSDYDSLRDGNEVVNGTVIRDQVVTDLINVYEQIDTLYQSGKTKASDKVFKPYYKEIEKILKNRFGPDFELVYEGGMQYACEIIGPLTETGVADIKTLFLNKKSLGLIIFSALGLLGTVEQVNKISKFNNYLEENPIIIDLANSRIENWPKGNKIRLYWDLVDNLSIYKYQNNLGIANKLTGPLDIETLVAPVIHEVGHAFTFLSSLYQTRKNRIVLEDAIRDQIKKGKSKESAFIIGFRETYGRNDPILKNKKNITYKDVILSLNRTEAKKFRFSQNVTTGTDHEVQADQFATRLGVSHELAIFLTKHSELRNFYFIDGILFGQLMFWVLCLIFCPGAFFNTLWLTIVVNIAFVLLGGLIYLFYGSIDNFFGNNNAGFTYDSDLRRVQKIRLDLVRQIRTSNLPDDAKKSLLQKADLIQELCSQYNRFIGSGKLSITVKRNLPILGWLGVDDGLTGAFDEYDKLIEENMENDLHLSLNRF